MLQECVEIFEEQMKKQAKDNNYDRIILDEYVPVDGDYIVVKKDGSVKNCSIRFDKKERKVKSSLTIGNPLYRDICFYDYHSRLINMNKPQDIKKLIHSNNYLSFWVKYDSLENGKLDIETIDNYFNVLSKSKDKYTKSEDCNMYDFVYQQIGDVDEEKLERNRAWIKEHIFKLDELGLDLKKNNYLKIFFEDDKDVYINEENRYVIPNIFNKNDYNIELNNNVYGLASDNLGLNRKKPFLKHKTRKIVMPNVITVQQAILQRKFFDFLMNKANVGTPNLFFDDISKEIIAQKNGEVVPHQFSGYFIQIQKGKTLLIKYQDIIVDYKYNLPKIFVLKKVLSEVEDNNKRDVYEDFYKEYINKKKIQDVLDEVLFLKCLKRNYFTDAENINVDVNIKANILMSRGAIFDWLYKEQKSNVEDVLRKVSLDMVKSSINQGHIGKAVLQFNMMTSLEEYFGGQDMAVKYNEIRLKIKEKINSKNDCMIESDEEYLYAVGQLIRYYISLNKSKEKKHSLANPFFNISNNEMLQMKLKQFFKKYNYCIDENSKRFNQLYSMVITYDYNKKINDTIVIAGYISSNLIYESSKNMED